MTASTGFVGKGTTLQIDFGAGLVSVANVVGITQNGRSVDDVDFTHLGSTGRYREYQPGMADPGSLAFNLHFDPTQASHLSIEAAISAGTTVTWSMDFSGAGKAKKVTGSGYLSGGDLSVAVSDPVGYAPSLRLSGPISIVDA